MKKLQWNMEEVFYFPTDIGVPTDNGEVRVNAGFTENRTEDSVRLTGIYHIAAQVDFSEGTRVEELPEEVVFVDDVELDGKSGYFEYAVPLYVDLPSEVEQPLKIEATDVRTKTDANGALTVSWNVNCTYEEPVQQEVAVQQSNGKETNNTTASPKADALVQVSEEVAIHDSSSWNGHDGVLSYIATLPDEWSTTIFRSNDVFVQEES